MVLNTLWFAESLVTLHRFSENDIHLEDGGISGQGRVEDWKSLHQDQQKRKHSAAVIRSNWEISGLEKIWTQLPKYHQFISVIQCAKSGHSSYAGFIK